MPRGKTTSSRVARIASKILRRKGSSKGSKSVAGSALSQVRRSRRKGR